MATDTRNSPTNHHLELAGGILRMGKKAGESVLAGVLPSPDEIAAIVNDLLSVILPGTRRTRLGKGFSGIVVGETTRIGNSVRIYQGVTLGALSIKRQKAVPKDGGKPVVPQRHPTVEDDVVIYANATILGGDTVIGRGAVVGANAWITYSVPPGRRVGGGS